MALFCNGRLCQKVRSIRKEKETIEDSRVSKTKRPSLKLNALSNWAPLVVNFIIGLLLTRYLIDQLGEIRYGTWALVGSFIGYYGLLRLGVGAAIMRYVPYYKGAEDPKAVSQVVSTGMTLFMTAGLVMFLASMLFAEPIARFYKGGDELASLVRVLGLVAALECPMRVLDACIRSHEQWVSANIVSIIAAITRGVGLAGCIYLGHGIVEMGYVVLAVTVLRIILYGILFMRFCSNVQLHPSLVRFSVVRTLMSFGILSVIITLAYTLTLQGHCLIIGKVISLKAVTVYAIPVLLIRNIRKGMLAPVRVFWPRFAYLDGTNDIDEVASLFLRGTRLTAIFASGVVLMVFVVGPSFIGLWMKGDFAAAYPVLLLLAGGYLIEGSQGIVTQLLCGTGHQRIQAMFASAESVIGIGLSGILTWKLGLTGAALGFVVAIVLMRGIVCPWYVCRLLDTSLLRYYKLMRPWLVLGVLTLTSYAVGVSELIDGWLALVSAAVIAGIVYVLCTYLFVLRADERTKLKIYIRKTIKQPNLGTDPVN